jgi:MoxR-like ATPase
MKSSSPIFIESVLSRSLRRTVEEILLFLVLFSGLSAIGLLNFGPRSEGVMLISIGLFLIFKMLDYYVAYSALVVDGPSFLLRYALSGQDPFYKFLIHRSGREFFSRLNIDKASRKQFLNSRKNSNISGTTAQGIHANDLKDLIGHLFDSDESIRSFFLKRNCSRAEVSLAAQMAERNFQDKMKESYREDDRRPGPGIGKSLAFGEAFLLEKFELSFKDLGITFEALGHEEEIASIGLITNRSREANAVLVGDDKLSIFSILYSFMRSSSRDMVILNAPLFMSEYRDKASFEANFLRLLDEAARAGNTLLVIPDLPNFIKSAASFGADVESMLDPYLASSPFGLIATATEGAYSNYFEHNPALSARFEKVRVAEEDRESVLNFILARVNSLEHKYKIFFTAGAILSIENSVLKFSEELVIDSTDDLLDEMIAVAKTKKDRTIKKEDVLARIESSTGVPEKEANKGEKERLSKLEELLGKRVIGQNEALEAVSSALRRARAGISSDSRPMGSFLFLGPTGVGKTETSKALSDIFFGDKAPLVRFDMSEYNSDEALSRLIGTLVDEGTLSKALREHGYGVLLLDEFEKTDKRVIDLFLQILDEGFFSDGQGKKVNVRNHIIIATSNASSDLIFNLIGAGKNLASEKDSIIKSLIDQGIFKPELLNRFDGIVLFKPLSKESLRIIARLMLEKLNKRLGDKGISLAINDFLIDFLVEKGQDPKFGARPLNRAIQDDIEALIAKRMIENSVASGDTITLTASDLV